MKDSTNRLEVLPEQAANPALTEPDFPNFLVGLAAEKARRWGVHPHAARPCVWLLLNRGAAAGDRNETCHVLAVELARAGLTETQATAALTEWAGLCEQPAHALFTPQEVAAVVRGVFARARRSRLFGYGCDRGLLPTVCPYAGAVAERKQVCQWIQRGRKGWRKQETLLQAVALAAHHKAPAGWSRQQEAEARWAWTVLAAEEKRRKVRPGGGLYLGERRLGQVLGGWGRSRVRRLLRDLAAAGWCEIITHNGEWTDRGRLAREIRRIQPGQLPHSA